MYLSTGIFGTLLRLSQLHILFIVMELFFRSQEPDFFLQVAHSLFGG
jgi:hypothetical protein